MSQLHGTMPAAQPSKHPIRDVFAATYSLGAVAAIAEELLYEHGGRSVTSLIGFALIIALVVDTAWAPIILAAPLLPNGGKCTYGVIGISLVTRTSVMEPELQFLGRPRHRHRAVRRLRGRQLRQPGDPDGGPAVQAPHLRPSLTAPSAPPDPPGSRGVF
jgi:hypothetical protein